MTPSKNRTMPLTLPQLLESIDNYINHNGVVPTHLILHPSTFDFLIKEYLYRQKPDFQIESPTVQTPFGQLSIIRSFDLKEGQTLLVINNIH